MFEFIGSSTSLKDIDVTHLESSIEQLIEQEDKIHGDIIIQIMTDKELLAYNNSLLEHDYYTDIITIDQSIGDIISGELLISIDRVIENSDNFAASPLAEFYRVCYHGVLHLIGYNDKTDEEKKIMRSKENFYLAQLNF